MHIPTFLKGLLERNQDHPDLPHLLRQFEVSASEKIILPEELSDPIGDSVHRKMKGLIHRYTDRVLIQPTLQCCVHCRFCFRKNDIGNTKLNLSRKDWEPIFEYLSNHTEIREVIFSGGDPLMLSNAEWEWILSTLRFISHLKILRLHTRVPLFIPQRIDKSWLAIMNLFPGQKWLSLHINSVLELSDESFAAVQLLHEHKIPLLAQTVLLKGINNELKVLKKLFLSLTEWGIKPYYLHYPDLVPGTHHFRPHLLESLVLFKNLRREIPGYALPRFIIDIPGGFGKIDIENIPFLDKTDHHIIAKAIAPIKANSELNSIPNSEPNRELNSELDRKLTSEEIEWKYPIP